MKIERKLPHLLQEKPVPTLMILLIQKKLTIGSGRNFILLHPILFFHPVISKNEVTKLHILDGFNGPKTQPNNLNEDPALKKEAEQRRLKQVWKTIISSCKNFQADIPPPPPPKVKKPQAPPPPPPKRPSSNKSGQSHTEVF